MKSKSAHQVPIIVGGFYRSGTSLVRRLLDAHSRIHCPPEIKFMKDFNGDYLHDDLAGLRFFGTVGSMGLEEDELLRIFGQAYVASRELACKRIGKVRWADKNPENALYLKQWHELLNGDDLKSVAYATDKVGFCHPSAVWNAWSHSVGRSGARPPPY